MLDRTWGHFSLRSTFNHFVWLCSTGVEHQPGPEHAATVSGKHVCLRAKTPDSSGLSFPDCHALWPQPSVLLWDPKYGMILESKNVPCLDTYKQEMINRLAHASLLQEVSCPSAKLGSMRKLYVDHSQQLLATAPAPFLNAITGDVSAIARRQAELFLICPIACISAILRAMACHPFRDWA